MSKPTKECDHNIEKMHCHRVCPGLKAENESYIKQINAQQELERRYEKMNLALLEKNKRLVEVLKEVLSAHEYEIGCNGQVYTDDVKIRKALAENGEL